MPGVAGERRALELGERRPVALAQQALYRAQQSSVVLRLAERANRIQLYKALGGGA